MHGDTVVRAMVSLDLAKRTPLLQMTPDELVRTYVSINYRFTPSR
jgi:hypothetical protein